MRAAIYLLTNHQRILVQYSVYSRPFVTKIATAYDNGIKKYFPRFYPIHRRIVDGSKQVWSDGRTLAAGTTVLWNGKRIEDLSRPQLELLILTPPEIKRIPPILIIACVPIVGDIFLVAALFLPRYFLTRHYWSDEQFIRFNEQRLAYRRKHYYGYFLPLSNAELEKCTSTTEALNFLTEHPKILNSHKNADFFKRLAQANRIWAWPTATVKYTTDLRVRILQSLDNHMPIESFPDWSLRQLQEQCYIRQLSVEGLSKDDVIQLLKAWLQLRRALQASKDVTNVELTGCDDKRMLLANVLSQLWKMKVQ